jgi:hypothetical protein
VLLCEAPGASGDQLALGAPESAVSLQSLASALAAGTRPRGGWWAQRENLRVLATAPAAASAAAVGLSGALLAAAGEQGLTVVDAGAVRDAAARELLAAATHVVWTLTVQPGSVEHARAVLASSLVPALAAAQAFALRADRRSVAPGRAVREVRRVCEAHGARQLLLLPYSAAVAQRPVDLGVEPLRRQLSTLDRFLRRP